MAGSFLAQIENGLRFDDYEGGVGSGCKAGVMACPTIGQAEDTSYVALSQQITGSGLRPVTGQSNGGTWRGSGSQLVQECNLSLGKKQRNFRRY